jgi:hypothetical protein
MNVLVTGSGGLVGSALVPALGRAGHRVRKLVRRVPGGGDEARWDPAGGTIDRAGLDGLDAVVHLAGESIAAGRWTASRKARIRDSRVEGTRLLCEALAGLDKPPAALISASAVGYYGDRGNEVLVEDSPPGAGFLPNLCCAWEAATQPAAERGIRVVLLRIGVVLSPKGGALARMLPAFKLGLGGRIGHGRQYLSWITLDDLVGVIRRVLADGNLSGPVNAVSPNPATNLEFTRALGRALSRPTIFPMPAWVARLAFGEMADALLLASARVRPERLLHIQHEFHHSTLETAFRHLLQG